LSHSQNNTDASANTDLAFAHRVDMAARNFEAIWLPIGKRKTEWEFFVPAKSTPDDSSSLTVGCFSCHAAKIDTLHHRFPPALDEETQVVDKEGGAVASIGIVNDVDFMQMADETHDTMAVEERERDHRKMLVEDEWARYVTAAAQLRQSGGFLPGITLLDWWRENANHFPFVSELARIILCILASQI
jgi:hypothetical protein